MFEWEPGRERVATTGLVEQQHTFARKRGWEVNRQELLDWLGERWLDKKSRKIIGEKLILRDEEWELLGAYILYM